MTEKQEERNATDMALAGILTALLGGAASALGSAAVNKIVGDAPDQLPAEVEGQVANEVLAAVQEMNATDIASAQSLNLSPALLNQTLNTSPSVHGGAEQLKESRLLQPAVNPPGSRSPLQMEQLLQLSKTYQALRQVRNPSLPPMPGSATPQAAPVPTASSTTPRSSSTTQPTPMDWEARLRQTNQPTMHSLLPSPNLRAEVLEQSLVAQDVRPLARRAAGEHDVEMREEPNQRSLTAAQTPILTQRVSSYDEIYAARLALMNQQAALDQNTHSVNALLAQNAAITPAIAELAQSQNKMATQLEIIRQGGNDAVEKLSREIAASNMRQSDGMKRRMFDTAAREGMTVNTAVLGYAEDGRRASRQGAVRDAIIAGMKSVGKRVLPELLDRGAQTLFNQPSRFLPPSERSRLPTITEIPSISYSTGSAKRMRLAAIGEAAGSSSDSDIRSMVQRYSRPSLPALPAPRSSRVVNKVIGDAPIIVESDRVRNVEPTPGSVNKVVGDAPSAVPGTTGAAESMDSDAAAIMDGAVAQSTSALPQLTLVARLLLSENKLDSASIVTDEDGLLGLWRSLSQAAIPMTLHYDSSPLRVCANLPGSAIVPFEWNVYFDGSQTRSSFMRDLSVSVTYDSSLASVPLSPTLDWTSMAAAISSGSASAFSSALRSETAAFSADAATALVEITRDIVNQRKGYSFAPTLISLLLNISALHFCPGDDRSEWVSGEALRYTPVTEDIDNSKSICFPFATTGVVHKIKIAACTYDTFVSGYLNRGIGNGVFTGDFSVQYWNSPFSTDNAIDSKAVAVVFLRTQDCRSGPVNLAYMLAHMMQPWMTLEDSDELFDLKFIDNAFKWSSSGSKVRYYPAANGVLIPGPTQRVLFVITDQVKSQGGNCYTKISVADSFESNATVTEISLRDDKPSTGGKEFNLTLVAQSVFGNRTATARQFMNAVGRWESYYDNASDRLTALRFVAGVTRLFGPTKVSVPPRPRYQEGELIAGYFYGGSDDKWPKFWNLRAKDENRLAAQLIVTTDALGNFWTMSERNDATGEKMYKRTPPPCSVYQLAPRDYLIECCVMRDLLLISEESALARLSLGVNRLAASLNFHSVLLAGASDVSHQVACLDWATKAAVPATSFRGFNVGFAAQERLLHATQRRLLSMLLMSGIQFPAMVCSPEVTVTSPVVPTAVAYIYQDTERPYVVPFSRVSHLAVQTVCLQLGVYDQLLELEMPRSTRSTMAITYQGVPVGQSNSQIFVDVILGRDFDGNGSRPDMLRKLTVNRVPNIDTSNPYVYLFGSVRSSQAIPLAYSFEPPDANLGFYLSVSAANNNTIPYNLAAFSTHSKAYEVPKESAHLGDSFDLAIPAGTCVDLVTGRSASWLFQFSPLTAAAAEITRYPPMTSLEAFDDPGHSFLRY